MCSPSIWHESSPQSIMAGAKTQKSKRIWQTLMTPSAYLKHRHSSQQYPVGILTRTIPPATSPYMAELTAYWSMTARWWHQHALKQKYQLQIILQHTMLQRNFKRLLTQQHKLILIHYITHSARAIECPWPILLDLEWCSHLSPWPRNLWLSVWRKLPFN